MEVPGADRAEAHPLDLALEPLAVVDGDGIEDDLGVGCEELVR